MQTEFLHSTRYSLVIVYWSLIAAASRVVSTCPVFRKMIMIEYVEPRDWASKTATESRVFLRVDSAQTPLQPRYDEPVRTPCRLETQWKLFSTTTNNYRTRVIAIGRLDVALDVLRENTVVSLLHTINQNRRNRTSINIKRTFINLWRENRTDKNRQQLAISEEWWRMEAVLPVDVRR